MKARKDFAARAALWLAGLAFLLALTGTGDAAAQFELKPNDVIALAGGANLERTRFNGHLHACLVAAKPELKVHVRNFAWEGDTVFEQWRDDSKEQWRRSRDWRQQLDGVGATVVVAQFGQMESLQGAAKLGAFVTAYEKLLDEFSAGGRRLVLLSPVPFEKTSSPTLPDLSGRNDDVRKYTEAVRALAARRGAGFVDLFTPFSRPPFLGPPLTENGYQLSERGHDAVALEIARRLGLNTQPSAQLARTREAAVELERCWFDFWRPRNWAFLDGDRTHVPFSRDWRNQDVRLFPEEMKEFAVILREAEDNVARVLAGETPREISPRSPIPVEPPPTPPQTPEEELASLKIHPDYRVNLFASEKDGVVKPVQIRWDERGRLWVACLASYPQVKPGERADDKIMVCEDTNGDGRADKFTVFADGLNMPTGLELGGGGLYVSQGTELWHLRDTDGDEHADTRRLVLGGFGTGDSHQMINGFSLGFGGELWFTQGHHIHSRVETPFGIEHLNRSGVWRLRPRTLRLDPFFQMSSAGANCWGVLTDDYGQVFHKSGADNGGFYSVPGLIRTDLALPSEIMRLFQARVKTVGFDFVSTRYFPDELQGAVVVGGFYDNTLQLHQLTYVNSEFNSRVQQLIIETTNKVFRPVDVRFGPDGAVYFADWYNPIIGHYQASYRHPDRDKSHGRVWRVTRKDRPPVKPAQLADASVDALLAQLDSSERWAKSQAKRLLFERDTHEVTAALDSLLNKIKPGEPRDEYLRLQALSVFEAHEQPRPDLLKSLLRSPDFRVRAYATRVLGNWRERVPDATALLERQVADDHPRVRLEAIVAASYLSNPAAIGIALRALDQPMDKYLDYALTKTVHALRPQWEPQLAAGRLAFARDEQLLFVLKNSQLTNAPQLIRQQLGNLSGDPAKSRPWLLALTATGGPEDLRLVFDRARGDAVILDALAVEADSRKVAPTGDVMADLEKLLSQPDESLRVLALRLAGLWKPPGIAERVRVLAEDEAATESVRAEALKSFARLRVKESLPLLKSVFEKARSQMLAFAALEAISRASLPDAAALTVRRLASATNSAEVALWLRPVLQLRAGAGALAKALPDGALTPAQARATLGAINNRGRFDEALFKRLSELAGFSAELPAYRPEFVREVADAARLSGRTDEGKKIYDTLGCAACHIINGEGGKIGPDLSALGRGLPVDMIVTETIWPQLNVKEGFEAVRVTTRDGRVLEGQKQSETADEVAIRDTLTGEVTRLRRAQVERQTAGGTVMPEGLVAPLTRPQLADLIRYLSELGR